MYLEDEDPLTWTLWVCPERDRSTGRYWREVSLRKWLGADEVKQRSGSLLELAYRTANSWGTDDLIPAGERVQLPES